MCLIAVAILFASLGALGESCLGQTVEYNRDIRPILSNNCFFCHGFDAANRKSGLRLDFRQDALDYGAIDPGDAQSSLIVEVINSDDPGQVMPPADSAYALSAAQKDLIKRWVEQGAKYQEHWAYRKLARPSVPQSQKRTAIDAFLQRRWTSENVRPVGQADPRQVLRRLSFDLRGLPPTQEEVGRFIKDPSNDNFQAFVKKWTRSIEYAEHQGLVWLDLVRWADSSGMVSDEPIATGAYRKYVIEAFEKNMPFDQFTREQLAGDLLPSRNDQTLVASGYNRLVKTNSEAGVIEKEALHALKGEHVRALGTVWLGATTGCAECHDHKYDPITAKDYYSLAAFFDDLIEIGVYEPGDRRFPTHSLYVDPELRQQDDQLSAQINTLRNEIYSFATPEDALAKWEATTLERYKKATGRADWAWMPAELPSARIATGFYKQTAAGRLVTAQAGELAMHTASETMSGFTDTIRDSQDVIYVNVNLDGSDPPTAIGMLVVNGDYQRQGWLPEYFTTYFWGDEADAELFEKTVKDPQRIVHMGAMPKTGKQVRLTIERKKVIPSLHDQVGLGWIQIGGKVTWGDTGYNLTAKSAISATLAESTLRYWWQLPQNRDDRANKMKLVTMALGMAKQDRRQVHHDVIRFAFQESQQPEKVTQLRNLYRAVESLRVRAEATALVSRTGPLKETKLRDRGNFMDETGPVLEPAIPEFLGKLDTGNRASRIDLADWIASRDNPLTARVFVNRLWCQFYGRGLSETLEDAGNQGDWPSHPELLDWLAVEFIESGWDVRHMVELMVSSEAYQLSSTPTEILATSDPANRLHTRQSRQRLQAEEIRDTALAAAGLLQPTTTIPVKSFYPYQPRAYWIKSNKVMFGSRYQTWETNQGKSQYQRSLYTYWKRQSPHPSLLAFDTPTRQECTAERTTTNTPGQALALMNDPIFVEAARVLAESILSDGSRDSRESRVELLFNKTLQRQPTDKELAILTLTVNSFESYYAMNPTAAAALLGVGQYESSTELSASQHAAWTATCRMVLNLHEFITRS